MASVCHTIGCKNRATHRVVRVLLHPRMKYETVRTERALCDTNPACLEAATDKMYDAETIEGTIEKLEVTK